MKNYLCEKGSGGGRNEKFILAAALTQPASYGGQADNETLPLNDLICEGFLLAAEGMNGAVNNGANLVGGERRDNRS